MSACPFCQELKTKVLETRPMQNGWIRRSRHCAFDCGRRFLTFEIPEEHLTTLDDEDNLKAFPRDRRK